jgi:hypothetical protein
VQNTLKIVQFFDPDIMYSGLLSSLWIAGYKPSYIYPGVGVDLECIIIIYPGLDVDLERIIIIYPGLDVDLECIIIIYPGLDVDLERIIIIYPGLSKHCK